MSRIAAMCRFVTDAAGGWVAWHLSSVVLLMAISMVILCVTAALVTYANRGSQTVGLGLAGLVATMGVFCLQLFFQLRADITREEPVSSQVLVHVPTRRVLPYPDPVLQGATLDGRSLPRFVLERDAARDVLSVTPGGFV
jgi:hypothetical protein